MGHSRFENPTYRGKEELAAWKARDPIPRLRQYLSAGLGVSEAELAALEQDVARRIEAAVAFAESSPDPQPDDYREFIFAAGGAA
jgi:pyruvate dehydrogenase E1 component alpha subunit